MTERPDHRARAEGKDRPRVSVVVPSYQHEPYVVQAVRSALESEIPAAWATARGRSTKSAWLEVVVMDDGSRDRSVERLHELRSSLPDGASRLRIEVQENQGAHRAFGRGLQLARGEILFLLNSDDVYAASRIPRLLACFDDPSVLSAASWLRIVGDDGQQLGVKHGWHDLPPWPKPRPGPSLAELGVPELALLESNWISTTSNLAFRRTALDQGLAFLDLRYCHDWEFLLGLCRAGLRGLGSLAVVEEPLVDYRVHSSNTLKEGSESAPESEARSDSESTRQDGSSGSPQDTGKGAMRFEILWLLARHAESLLRAYDARHPGAPGLGELRHRLWNSLPRFGADTVLWQLLTLRGQAETPPAAFDALLRRDHPYRRRAIEVLAATPD